MRHKAHEAEDRLTVTSARVFQVDQRDYPSSHAAYDLAELTVAPPARRFYSAKKANNKYNIPRISLLNEEQIAAQITLFRTKPSLGGVPGFIDAFFKGEPGGRAEGFSKRPEQFCGTHWDPELGGFMISPNWSYIPESKQNQKQCYTDNAATLLENTRTSRESIGTGFGLVAYWIPPGVFENYPRFRHLFFNEPMSDAARQRMDTSAEPDRQERSASQESNQAYADRTGVEFLAIPLNLRRKHVPLLEALKTSVHDHLKTVYGCDSSKENVRIYSHSPIYGGGTHGLHFHVRVNHGTSALESDLRTLMLDDAIHLLSKHDTIKPTDDDAGPHTHYRQTSSGKLISYNTVNKKKNSENPALESTTAPNPWAAPPRKKQE